MQKWFVYAFFCHASESKSTARQFAVMSKLGADVFPAFGSYVAKAKSGFVHRVSFQCETTTWIFVSARV
jgi:hypothetical protein